jgi:peptidoglycan/xylan/chitin deacetylase (PgdA/CDA1 family)
MTQKSVGIHEAAEEDEVVLLRALVLMYHRILPDPGEDPLGINISLEHFNEQLDLLAARYDVRDMAELSRFLAEQKLPEGAIWITFDDGYRDGLMHACSSLLSRGLTAAFFVPTGYLGSEAPLVDERLRRIIENTVCPRLTLPSGKKLSLETADQRYNSIHGVLRYMHDLALDEKEAFVADLSRDLGVPHGPVEDEHLPMTWPHIRVLLRQGMTVGSHGRTHRSLAALTRHEIDDELDGSRADLLEHAGIDARTLSYPYGRPADVNPAVIGAATGYDLAFTASPGPLLAGQHPLLLRRIEVKDWNGQEFARQIEHAFSMKAPMERFEV